MCCWMRAPRSTHAHLTHTHLQGRWHDRPSYGCNCRRQIHSQDPAVCAKADPTLADEEGKLPLDCATKVVHTTSAAAVRESALLTGWLHERRTNRLLDGVLLSDAGLSKAIGLKPVESASADRVYCVLLRKRLCCYTNYRLERAIRRERVHFSLGVDFEGVKVSEDAVGAPQRLSATSMQSLDPATFELRFSNERPTLLTAASIAERDEWIASIRSAANGTARSPAAAAAAAAQAGGIGTLADATSGETLYPPIPAPLAATAGETVSPRTAP